MENEDKAGNLSITLFKKGTARGEVLRSDVECLLRIPISADFEFEGEVYSDGLVRQTPGWGGVDQSGTAMKIAPPYSYPASFLVVLSFRGRVFALPFGDSSSWISKERIEPRFGFAVALKATLTDEEEASGQETPKQIEIAGQSHECPVAASEHLRQCLERGEAPTVSVNPADRGFAHRLSGSDDLVMESSVSFDGLGSKCGEALRYFERESYPRHYRWLESFRFPADDPILTQLGPDEADRSTKVVAYIHRMFTDAYGGSSSWDSQIPEHLKPFVVERTPDKNMLDISEAASRLEVSPETVRRWIEQRDLLGWKSLKGEVLIPAEQIAGPDSTVPGIKRVLEIIGNPELTWEFLSHEWPFEHDVMRPLDKLKAGYEAEVIDSAPSFGVTFS